ncbi:homeobox protein luminidependens [Phtheirospermum japonicum]|uniref:Homeobox protein luminidependens n=1 Tax=Phtheirospermum japonicum TaxID=374723 RepID=A0A830BP70_9LAMI|nr:homeobox protein luminidependens [Phtheirospermum japonicum]
MEEWCVGDGANSKEVEFQKNRIRREREIVYRSTLEIPLDPKEPWDREMDPDDSLTPEIPIEQLPDVEPLETPSVSHNGNNEIVAPVASTSSENMPGPDLELLAELLKNPQLVFALTSGQAGNLSGDATVKLLDMIKANGVSSLGGLAGNAENKVEVSLPSPTPSTEPVPVRKFSTLCTQLEKFYGNYFGFLVCVSVQSGLFLFSFFYSLYFSNWMKILGKKENNQILQSKTSLKRWREYFISSIF